jgi:hypothetical protein
MRSISKEVDNLILDSVGEKYIYNLILDYKDKFELCEKYNKVIQEMKKRKRREFNITEIKNYLTYNRRRGGEHNNQNNEVEFFCDKSVMKTISHNKEGDLVRIIKVKEFDSFSLEKNYEYHDYYLSRKLDKNMSYELHITDGCLLNNTIYITFGNNGTYEHLHLYFENTKILEYIIQFFYKKNIKTLDNFVVNKIQEYV